MFESIKAKVLRAGDLEDIRIKYIDKRIIFCSGCFDILQSGHAVFFNQCKQFGDILVVGIGRDVTVQLLKGPDRPVNPEVNRLYLVAAFQEVDFVVLNDDMIGEGKIDFYDKLALLKPDVFVLNDDDNAIAPKKALCEKHEIKFILVPRIVPEELIPTSTSKIIHKINFSLKAPLRIDFAGGWTDVPYIMNGEKGYVSNIAIRPLIELKGGEFNFSGYPRGSGLSTSTAVKLLEMLNAKSYNAEPKGLEAISEDLFNLENKELQWFIGRQDQYAIVYGGFHCFEFGSDYARPLEFNITRKRLDQLRKHIILIHTGESRNAQMAVEEVYRNYNTPEGQQAILELCHCGYHFAEKLLMGDIEVCAKLSSRNWEAQKLLAPSSTTNLLDDMYTYALDHDALGGKICGAGGGGAFVFYSYHTEKLKKCMKAKFPNCFEIDFDFELNDIKKLNHL
jgi:cytidyltransferase-like protein